MKPVYLQGLFNIFIFLALVVVAFFALVLIANQQRQLNRLERVVNIMVRDSSRIGGVKEGGLFL